ncbi:hypothetical protein DFJ73DRAFT_820906 [Zopfochytrium polystomum]|nr:hypothetical protein DFJ73DRAFT_820906 [Zopfochytrium polystomum]
MNKQVAKVSAMNPDGTLNVKATLANAKKTKQSLEATNKQRISGGKAALDFSAKQPKAAKWTAVKDPVTGETTYKKAAPPSAETGSKSKGTREAPKSADGSKIGGKKSPNAAGAASREVSRDKTGASTGKAAKIANGAISKWKLPTVGKSTSHPKKAPAKSKQTKAAIKPKTTKKATRPKKQPAKKAPPKRSAPAEKKQTNKAANGKAMMKASGSRKQPPKKISARKGAPATAAKSAPLSRKQNGKKK